MKVYRVQNQSFPIRIEFNGMTQRLTVEAGKELAKELAKATELTPEPSADVVERVAKAVNDFRDDPTMFTGTEYRWVFLVKALAPIIEAEVERRVRERNSRIEATELVCEIHRRSEKVGDDEDFELSVGREWYDSFCACLEDSGKGS